MVRAALVFSTLLFLLSIYSLGTHAAPDARRTTSARRISLSGALPFARWRSPVQAAHPRPHPRVHDNGTRANPLHGGVSRTPIVGREGSYLTAPLPSLRQAFAHLYPVLNAIKDATPAVPREHNLAAPIFPPFLSPAMKERYAHLAPEYADGVLVQGTERRILLVAVCRQVAGMLSDWFATWTVLADFLGPESLVISLIEGQSDDGSGELLAGALRDHLLFIGVPPKNIFVTTHTPELDWKTSHRIELLARMRNDAMAPIFESETPHLSPDGKEWSAVVWHNDVYFGAAHVLELLHQHEVQDADITCGWDHAGKWFYDGWVGRDMSGDLYSPFPVSKEDEEKAAKVGASRLAREPAREWSFKSRVLTPVLPLLPLHAGAAQPHAAVPSLLGLERHARHVPHALPPAVQRALSAGHPAARGPARGRRGVPVEREHVHLVGLLAVRLWPRAHRPRRSSDLRERGRAHARVGRAAPGGEGMAGARGVG